MLTELRSTGLPAPRHSPTMTSGWHPRLPGKYGDMQLGLTDASIVVQAARHKTTKILSLDHKHFTAVRPLTSDASFTLLPRDDHP